MVVEKTFLEHVDENKNGEISAEELELILHKIDIEEDDLDKPFNIISKEEKYTQLAHELSQHLPGAISPYYKLPAMDFILDELVKGKGKLSPSHKKLLKLFMNVREIHKTKYDKNINQSQLRNISEDSMTDKHLQEIYQDFILVSKNYKEKTFPYVKDTTQFSKDARKEVAKDKSGKIKYLDAKVWQDEKNIMKVQEFSKLVFGGIDIGVDGKTTPLTKTCIKLLYMRERLQPDYEIAGLLQDRITSISTDDKTKINTEIKRIADTFFDFYENNTTEYYSNKVGKDNRANLILNIINDKNIVESKNIILSIQEGKLNKDKTRVIKQEEKKVQTFNTKLNNQDKTMNQLSKDLEELGKISKKISKDMKELKTHDPFTDEDLLKLEKLEDRENTLKTQYNETRNLYYLLDSDSRKLKIDKYKKLIEMGKYQNNQDFIDKTYLQIDGEFGLNSLNGKLNSFKTHDDAKRSIDSSFGKGTYSNIQKIRAGLTSKFSQPGYKENISNQLKKYDEIFDLVNQFEEKGFRISSFTIRDYMKISTPKTVSILKLLFNLRSDDAVKQKIKTFTTKDMRLFKQKTKMNYQRSWVAGFTKFKVNGVYTVVKQNGNAPRPKEGKDYFPTKGEELTVVGMGTHNRIPILTNANYRIIKKDNQNNLLVYTLENGKRTLVKTITSHEQQKSKQVFSDGFQITETVEYQKSLVELNRISIYKGRLSDLQNKYKGNGVDKYEVDNARQTAKLLSELGNKDAREKRKSIKTSLTMLLSKIPKGSIKTREEKLINQQIKTLDNLIENFESGKIKQFVDYFYNEKNFDVSNTGFRKFVQFMKNNGLKILAAIVGGILIVSGVGAIGGGAILATTFGSAVTMTVGAMIGGRLGQWGNEYVQNYGEETFIMINGKKKVISFDDPTDIELYMDNQITGKQLTSGLVMEFSQGILMQTAVLGSGKIIGSKISNYILNNPGTKLSKVLQKGVKSIKPGFFNGLKDPSISKMITNAVKKPGFRKNFQTEFVQEIREEGLQMGTEKTGEMMLKEGKNGIGYSLLAMSHFMSLFSAISPGPASIKFMKTNGITNKGITFDKTTNIVNMNMEYSTSADTNTILEFYKRQGLNLKSNNNGVLTFTSPDKVMGGKRTQDIILSPTNESILIRENSAIFSEYNLTYNKIENKYEYGSETNITKLQSSLRKQFVISNSTGSKGDFLAINLNTGKAILFAKITDKYTNIKEFSESEKKANSILLDNIKDVTNEKHNFLFKGIQENIERTTGTKLNNGNPMTPAQRQTMLDAHNIKQGLNVKKGLLLKKEFSISQLTYLMKANICGEYNPNILKTSLIFGDNKIEKKTLNTGISTLALDLGTSDGAKIAINNLIKLNPTVVETKKFKVAIGLINELHNVGQNNNLTTEFINKNLITSVLKNPVIAKLPNYLNEMFLYLKKTKYEVNTEEYANHFNEEVLATKLPTQENILSAKSRIHNGDVVSIGDLGGSYSNILDYLSGAGVIEVIGDKMNWIGGNKKVIFQGDILGDRSPNGMKIFLAINKLNKQAKEEGGVLKVIVGNHDDAFISMIMKERRYKSLNFTDFTSIISFKGLTQWLVTDTKMLQDINNSNNDGPKIPKLPKQFYKNELIDVKDVIVDNDITWDQKFNNILGNIKKMEGGTAFIETVCNTEIINLVNGDLFLHTNVTKEIMDLITTGESTVEDVGNSTGEKTKKKVKLNGETLIQKIDEINKIRQDGLTNSLLKNNSNIDPRFNAIANLFLSTNNNSTSINPRHYAALPINTIYRGHTIMVKPNKVQGISEFSSDNGRRPKKEKKDNPPYIHIPNNKNLNEREIKVTDIIPTITAVENDDIIDIRAKTKKLPQIGTDTLGYFGMELIDNIGRYAKEGSGSFLLQKEGTNYNLSIRSETKTAEYPQNLETKINEANNLSINELVTKIKEKKKLNEELNNDGGAGFGFLTMALSYKSIYGEGVVFDFNTEKTESGTYKITTAVKVPASVKDLTTATNIEIDNYFDLYKTALTTKLILNSENSNENGGKQYDRLKSKLTKTYNKAINHENITLATKTYLDIKYIEFMKYIEVQENKLLQEGTM